jgi:hypothetical protein
METTMLIENKISTHEFKHMSREPGTFKLDFECYSLSYKGLDYKQPIEITVLKESAKRKVIKT